MKSIKAIQEELNSEFKTPGLVQIISNDATPVLTGVGTGSMRLNMALSGSPFVGFTWGRIVEIYGAEQSGKTTLTLHVLAEAQKLGLYTAFVDAEHALDVRYARSIGVNFDELLFIQPDSGEQALQAVEAMIKKGVRVIVVDSVASLTPQAEIDGDIGDAHIGLQARLMSQAMRKLTPIVKQNEAILIFINQIRMKIGVMFGNPETTSGGKALRFYASYRLDCRSPRGGAVKGAKDLSGDVEETGIEMKVKVVKNKVYPPFKTAQVTIDYGKGFDKFKDVVVVMKRMGAFKVVKSKGKSREVVDLPESGKQYTAQGLLKALRNSSVDDPIRRDVITVLKELDQ